MALVGSILRMFHLMWQDSPAPGDQLVRGSFVLVVGRLAIKLVQFARTIVLARLLFPEDIGLFGLAALSLGFMDLFLQPGFNAALIHEKGDVHKYLNTAWSGQIIRNTSMGVLVFFAAPFLGDFFGHPEIVSLTRVLALSLVIVGFENVGIVLFQKELRFNRKFFLDISIVLIEVAVVITAGFIFRNAWALVIGGLANRIAAVVLSYAFHPYRPKFAPKLDQLRYLFRYGKWISLAAVVSYLVNQGDNFSVGKLLGPESLGYYQAAFALALLPVAEFGRTLGNALFPMFAKIAADRREDAFLRVAQLIFAFTVPASLGIFALAQDIVPLLYGPRWVPMVPIVSVLAFYALVRSFDAVGVPFFNGIGKPKISTSALFVQCVTMAVLLIPLVSKFSTVGAAWAMLASGGASALLYITVLLRDKLLRPGELFMLVTPPLIAGLGMVFAIRMFEYFLSVGNVFVLFLYVGLGAGVYFALLWVVDRVSGGEIFNNFRWIQKRVLNKAS